MQLLPVTRKRIQCNYDLFSWFFFLSNSVRWSSRRGFLWPHWEPHVVRGRCRPCRRNQKFVRQSVKLVRRISGLGCTGLSIWYPYVCSLGYIRVCWKDSLRSLFVSSVIVAFPFLHHDISRNMISYLNSEGKHQLHFILIQSELGYKLYRSMSVPRYIQVHPRPGQNISCYRYHAIG